MVLDQIKEILKDTMDIDESKITLDAKLKEDLELDSLDSVELIMSAEEEFENSKRYSKLYWRT